MFEQHKQAERIDCIWIYQGSPCSSGDDGFKIPCPSLSISLNNILRRKNDVVCAKKIELNCNVRNPLGLYSIVFQLSCLHSFPS